MTADLGGEVLDFLAASAQVIQESGGWLHPGIEVRADASGLSVANRAPDGEPLMIVPRECWVPVGDIAWAASDELAFRGPLPDLGMPAREITMVQIGLHNARGALARLADEHPQLAPNLPTPLVQAVRVFRSSFRRHAATPAELFWSMRCFTLPSPERHRMLPMLVPFVDLLNHHGGAGTGGLSEHTLRVDIHHDERSSECFLNYGRARDPIGMAVVYGFVDASNPFAHSAPVVVMTGRELHASAQSSSAFSTVEVRARGRSATGDLLPMRVTATPDALHISRVTFDRRTTLWDLTDELARAASLDTHTAARVIQAIADANDRALTDVIDAARGAFGVAGTTLAGAATVQRETIRAMLNA